MAQFVVHFKFPFDSCYKVLEFLNATVVKAAEVRSKIHREYNVSTRDSYIVLLNPQTEEEYKDEDLIPRCSQVLGKRRPAEKKARPQPAVINTRTHRDAVRDALVYKRPATDDPAPRPKRVRRAHGIPKSQLVQVYDANVLGAMQLEDGTCVMSKQHAEAYLGERRVSHQLIDVPQPKERPSHQKPVTRTDSPEEYTCPVCRGVLREATIISCCGNSACKTCICASRVSGEACPCCTRPFSSATFIFINVMLDQLVQKYLKGL